MGDFSNSEDTLVWPRDLPQLKNIDDRLHCPICFNYMKNPVLSTICSHNCNTFYYLLTLIDSKITIFYFFLFSVCSLCIRSSISLKNSCPICFLEISDGVLRPNRCLEEIIKCFQPVKNYVLQETKQREQSSGGKQLEENLQAHSQENYTSATIPGKSSDPPRPPDHQQLHAFQIANGHTPSKTNFAECSHANTLLTPIHQTQSQKLSTTPPSSLPCASSLSRPIVQQQRAASSQAVKEVACPVCNVYMRETMINVHLDSCLNKNKPVKRKPLPKLIYTIMKDTELRKRLKDLGLCATGDKATLVSRHKKFTILYNSECDAAEPRPVEELRAQFEQEEAESRRLANELRYAIVKVKSTDAETIEKENMQYIQNNKEIYDRLINDIRQRQAVKTETGPREEENVPLKEEIAGPSKEEDVPRKEANDSDDEVTVLVVPPKVYETISLSDSSDDELPTKDRAASTGSSSSSEELGARFSSCSIPDPAESTDSSSSNEGQTITLLSTDSSSGSALSPSYSPVTAEESKLSHQFASGPETSSTSTSSSSSCSSSPLPTPQSTVGRKRSQPPLKASSERRMSLRRRT